MIEALQPLIREALACGRKVGIPPSGWTFEAREDDGTRALAARLWPAGMDLAGQALTEAAVARAFAGVSGREDSDAIAGAVRLVVRLIGVFVG